MMQDHSKRCRGSGFYYPPNPLALPTKPEPFHHYLKPIFIWRPDISFNLPQISCTANKCHGSLKSDGLYQNGPRKYVSLQNYGYIVTWSYRCSSCSKKLCGWSEEFLKVLPPHVQQCSSLMSAQFVDAITKDSSQGSRSPCERSPLFIIKLLS